MIALGKLRKKSEVQMSLYTDVFRKRDSPMNPALERAMRELARNDNAKTRASLYKAILASTFIVQGNVSGGTEVLKGKWIADSSPVGPL
jgi:hypothetical protein